MSQDTASPSSAPSSRRGRGVKALVASGLFTCASFFASFFAIAIVVRDISTLDRAGFFLFLAIYGPIATVLSQRFLLSIYQSRQTRRSTQLAELAVIAALTLLVVSLAITDYFSWGETLALVGVIFSQTFAATTAGSIQHRSRSSLGWAALVFVAATLRIALTWVLLPFGPVFAFAAAAYAYLGVILLLNAVFSRADRSSRPESEAATGSPDSWRERLAEFAFFVSGALLFQADKYALNLAGRVEELSQSGALTTLLLSPLSIMFATLYRSKSDKLFSADIGWRNRIALVPRIFLLFLAGAGAFLVALLLFWPQPAQLIFPFLSLPPAAYLALACAILADRLVTLLTFTGMDWRIYLVSALSRVAIFALVMFGANSWFSGSSLSELYLVYAAGAMAALLLVFSVLFWIQRSHVRR